METRIVVAIAIAAGAAVFSACSSTRSGTLESAETAWSEARAKFVDEDYLEAERLLETVKLQYAGSAHADSVQFLLGECNEKQGKHILAAYEFASLRRSFPSSPLNRAAQFSIAESYYAQSPPSGIDQEYTLKAIDEYQAFLELYGRSGGAADSLVASATARIKELRNRVGKKYYESAVLYFNMNQFKACIVYTDLVQDKYYDTDYPDRAQLLKIKCMIELRRFSEAKREIDTFLEKYRSSALVPDVRAMRESIADKTVSPQ